MSRGNDSPLYQDIHLRVLVELTEQLKIPKSKYDDAEKKYMAVGKYLHRYFKDDEDFKDLDIYLQGSVNLRTSVKPYGSNEYDIDLVLHMPHLTHYHLPESVKAKIGEALNANGNYDGKVKELNRGWRIEYAGDFHLDITPAIPDDACNNACPINKHLAEFVPDSKLEDWKASNPRGYYEWFHKIDEIRPIFAKDSRRSFAMESANIQDVPSQDEYKGVLRRTIQLLKRHRDVFFNEKNAQLKKCAPISILITTLAAQAYEGLMKSQKYITPLDLIQEIILHMPNYILDLSGTIYVGNPTNLHENFAEKWNELGSRHEEAFERWIEAVHKEIEVILSSEGLDIVAKNINESFGSEYGNKVIAAFNKDVSDNRALGVVSGLMLADGVTEAKAAKNTFYVK
jgi:hypothetical protein